MPEPSSHPENMYIFFLGSQIATGGSQRILLLQASWFYQHGYSVSAAFLYDKENLLPAWSLNYPFPIYDLGFAPPTHNVFMQAAYSLRGLWRLFRLLTARRYVAIETFAHHANLVGLPLAWIAGIPRRIGSHRGKIEGLSPLLESIHAMIVNSPVTTKLVVPAKRVGDDAVAEGIQPHRIVEIANGVAIPKVEAGDVLRLRAELGRNENDVFLLSVGRLRHQKGHAVLLRALPMVLRQFPNTMMLIAGDGPLRQELQAEAESLGISEQVRFLGVRNDIPVLMTLADLFLFPSRFEGMPNAVLEAMSHGLPVIATAVQGVDEIIRDGDNGVIVPLEDPGRLADAILRLLSYPEERRRLGRSAQATIEKDYTVDKMCIKYEKLLLANAVRYS